MAKWTRKPPTEPGFYWLKPDDEDVTIALVAMMGSKLRFVCVGNEVELDFEAGDLWGPRIEQPEGPC